MNNANHETGAFVHFESFKALKAVHLLTDGEKEKFRKTRLTSQLLKDFMTVADLDVTTTCFILGTSGHAYRETCDLEAFTVDHSERIMALAELYAHGYSIYNNRETFNYWMKAHARFLGGIPPLSIVNSLVGVKEMISKLTAIDHGATL
ncbi:hypothetical protein [Chitinophaga sp. YIM B06452]|uniref:hypothetical protein n=1 Tax=Chitinophaga sp. YIM B06452 TaxID=3082158 RepID=UPI0031FEC06D